MSRLSICRLVLTAALAGLAALPVSAADKTTPGERIRKTFDEVISIEIVDQPLFLALNQLREKTKVNFIVDRLTIQMVAQQMGQDAEGLPVNVKVKDKTVKEALRAIIKPYNLGYAIIGDAVVISTEAMTTERQLKQHVAVDVDKVEVAAALLRLKKETATNIVLDAAVEKGEAGKTPVTLQMEDVPLETAVRLLAEMAGLQAVREANVLKIKPRPKTTETPKAGPPDADPKDENK